MAEVYFYLPAEEAGNAVECGLKLTRWLDKEVEIDGEKKKCISALLNPKDDIQKYKSPDFRCLKLEVPARYCFVADGYLYRVGLNSPEVMAMYRKSIIPVEKYIFGSYRKPECLVTTTVISGQAGILDKRRDIPVLYDNSEDLYINNIIEVNREKHRDFNDALLYYFYCSLAERGKITKVEDVENGIAVFIDERKCETCTIRVPDMEKY